MVGEAPVREVEPLIFEAAPRSSTVVTESSCFADSVPQRARQCMKTYSSVESRGIESRAMRLLFEFGPPDFFLTFFAVS
jgi:hypothetical protein